MDRNNTGRYRDPAILGSTRVHISRSACVNDFRDVGLLLRSCITWFYNANATDTELEVSYFADPGRPIKEACFNMQIKM